MFLKYQRLYEVAVLNVESVMIASDSGMSNEC